MTAVILLFAILMAGTPASARTGWECNDPVQLFGLLQVLSNVDEVTVVSRDGSTVVATSGMYNIGKVYVSVDGGAPVELLFNETDRVPGNQDKRRGYALAISSDGRTLAVLAFQGLSARFFDVTYIFVRALDGGYTQQSRLLLTSTVGQDVYVQDLDLDGSGNTLVVGAPRNANNRGALFVFERDAAGAWSQTAKITPAVTRVHVQLGFEVEISANGLTIAATAPFAPRGIFVYRKQSSGWVQQGLPLPTPGRVRSLALSADARVAAAIVDSGIAIFEAGSPDWVLKTTILRGAPLVGGFEGPALSRDGSVLAVASILEKGSIIGAVPIFKVQPNGTYALSATLTAYDGAPYFTTLDITADGRTVVAGEYERAVWRFDACPKKPLPPPPPPTKVCYIRGATLECDDSDPCTWDRCVFRQTAASGVCANVIKFAGCKPCQLGQDARDCDDGDPCTADRCTVNGWCRSKPLKTPNCN